MDMKEVKSIKYCIENRQGSVFEESNNEGDERLSINLCELAPASESRIYKEPSLLSQF